MSVYNGEKYLREAIDSILNQTFTDFEFIIINDGSTDKTREILESYHDPRIRLFHQENIGLTKSLNMGLTLAKGQYIARQDADDISLPQRFEIQLKYFDDDASLTCCGCKFRVIDENGHFIWRIYPTISDKLIGWELLSWHLLFGNEVAHSSVIITKEALIELGGYAEGTKRAQDYALWSRMILIYKMVVIPDILIYWRYHHQGISKTHSDQQWQTAFEIIHLAHERLTGLPINKDYSIHLHELVQKKCYYIKPYTIRVLKLMNLIRLSFINHYQPDLNTQTIIEAMIQLVHRNLFKAAIRRFSIHSFMVALYILISRPIIAIQEVIKLSRKLIDKILNHGIKRLIT